MADDDSSLQQLISVPTILALLTVVGAVISFHPFLNSSRSPSGSDQGDTRTGSVEARLWQDPYEAAQKHEDSLGTNDTGYTDAESITTLAYEITDYVKKATGVTVLSVMETAKPYADDHESRLKSRYAVVSALGAAGYAPADSDHIRYFAAGRVETNDYGWEVISNTTSKTVSKMLVPFEWFGPSSLHLVPGQQKNQKVLVLWLDDDAFRIKPLARLATLLNRLTQGLTDDSNISFKVVGPRSSNRLKEMVEDDSVVAQAGTAISSNNFSIYSIWATASDALLCTNSFHDQPPRDVVRNKLRETNKVGFWNVACTDEQLAEALIRELEFRNVILSKCATNSVVLISEWDTFYGRALPLTFAAEVLSNSANRNFAFPPEVYNGLVTGERTNGFWRPLNWPRQISRFSYLKGVDGTLPTADRTKKANASDNQADVGELLRPEGDSQLDSIPRLAWKLNEFDWQDRTRGKYAIKAIGVLGSDVYDKLLLLQALRQEFPTAVLFTTDLDARLLDSSQWKWTRNLIVASSFGLELGRDLQGEIPPFRDCYQTAQFLACRIALGEVETNVLDQLKPHVYEVGRNGALDLGTLTDQPEVKEGQADLYPMWWQYHPFVRGWVVKYAVLATFFGLVLMALLGDRIKSFSSDERSETNRFRMGSHYKALALVFAMFIVFECWLGWRAGVDQRTNGAPFSLTEGNSIWPAEFLRSAAAFLGIGFLVHAHFRSKTVLDKLADSFSLSEQTKTTETASTAEKKSNDPAEIDAKNVTPHPWDIRIDALRYENGLDTFDVGRLFARYRELAATRNHYLRAGLRAALYIGFYVLLFLVFGFPYVPARGDPASSWCKLSLWNIDFMIMSVAVMSCILLVFYVADSTWLCARFVRLLQGRTSCWPKEARNTFAGARGMQSRPEDVTEWIDICMIARLTDIVGKLIYRPFVLLFILVAARNPWFARWDWPLPLILVLSTSSLYVLYSGHVLRTTAERGRSIALTTLRERLSQAMLEKEEARANQISLIIKDVKSLKAGAFAPWSQRPVLRALLIPFGGTGLLQLIQYLATMR